MSEDKFKNIHGEFKIKITDDVLPGTYANQIVIMHSRDEFIIDFVAAFPPEPCVVSRIVITPGHFKRIHSALKENLKKYEATFGEIEVSGEPFTHDENSSVH